MQLKLMYITNKPEVALIAEKAGVDRIFIDLEYIGKSLRQGGMDTVQSKHSLDDIKIISEQLTKAELLVRVNPIHEATEEYCSSKEEINKAIENGADILMLPYFKSIEEVRSFVTYVNGRCKTILLVETPEAVDNIDEVIGVRGIDEMYIGLNDLSISYGKRFMFEILGDGTVDYLANKFKDKNISYGFGGLASLEGGALPGKMVLKEHYRLKSQSVILSRGFCNTAKVTDLEEVKRIFEKEVSNIRRYEEECKHATDYEENRVNVKKTIERILRKL